MCANDRTEDDEEHSERVRRMIKVDRQLMLLVLALVLCLSIVAVSAVSSIPMAAGNFGSHLESQDIPALNYHKVDNYHHALSIPPGEFEEQIKYLHDNGYHSINPDDLVANIKYGNALPDKPILITFDDGYADNYSNAYPILKKYNFTATIFIITNMVGKDPRFVTWEQVREMQESGFVFASHTVNHLPLTNLPADQIENELVQSRDEITQQLGVTPKYFAYPTGAYNLQIEDIVRKTGYTAAFTIRYGQDGPKSDLYALERIPIFKSQQTFRSFFIRLNGAPLLERFGAIRN